MRAHIQNYKKILLLSLKFQFKSKLTKHLCIHNIQNITFFIIITFLIKNFNKSLTVFTKFK